MTKCTPCLKRYPIINSLTVILLLCPAFLFPGELAEGVISGIRLAAFGVIPAIFPYSVISDALRVLITGGGVISCIFSKIFSTSKNALGVFIIGTVCGFPIGVKSASDLYLGGVIKKEEAEHLIGFCCNPGLAFVISGVGVGILGSFRVGVLLYISVVLSALLCGFVFKPKRDICDNTDIIPGQKFDFVASVKSAGFTSITISSYIIFFSAVLGLIKHIFKNTLFTLGFAAILEVSSGVKYTASGGILPSEFILPTVAFILGFSGLSVHLQARSLAPREICFKRFYLMKILQGVISFALVFFLQ